MADGRLETTHEGVDRAGADGGTGPAVAIVLGLDPLADEIDELAEGADRDPFELDRTRLRRLRLLEPGGDVLDHDRVLRPVVLDVGEEERVLRILQTVQTNPVRCVARHDGQLVGTLVPQARLGARHRNAPEGVSEPALAT